MRLVEAGTACQVAAAKTNALPRLWFHGVYRVTWRQPGHKRRRYIGMAPLVRSCRLRGTRLGIRVRWIVNSPERREQRAIGMLYRRPNSVLVVCEPDEFGVIRHVVFEPLTRARFIAMRTEIGGHTDLSEVLVTDDLLRTYFWADWVPDYWHEYGPT